METTARRRASPLFRNRFSLFLRGEGGFGGDPGPRGAEPPPEEAPDLVVESPTLPQQALLYRLLGDKNPLHADPGLRRRRAASSGPSSTACAPTASPARRWSTGCSAGDTAAVAGYRARFAGVVVPGDTIVTSMWRRGERIHLAAADKERGTPVLANAVVTLR